MPTKSVLLLSLASVLCLWVAQPPLGLWPLALGALVPLIVFIDQADDPKRQQHFLIWLAGLVYWLFTLQGLRHAHPAMALGWIALSVYLACYLPLFVFVARKLIRYGIPLSASVPIAWVGLECIRNYLASGISVAMLGHTMANVPVMTQIADLLGTYGVSFVVSLSSVALFLFWKVYQKQVNFPEVRKPLAIIGAIFGATIAYGVFRLQETSDESLATFALIQRDEKVEYVQDSEREIQIVEGYTEQTMEAAESSGVPIDAIVWPESMATGGVPWYTAEEEAKVPSMMKMSQDEFNGMIRAGQSFVEQRAFVLQRNAQLAAESDVQPHLILGSAVIRYDERPYIYSGALHLEPRGEMKEWYGKTHLVMFGEYVPLVGSIQRIRAKLPGGMGIDVGPGPKIFTVGETKVSPNICIETAVERVTVNQAKFLWNWRQMPDVIVNVTNDGWFDDSSILEHHLRCAQLVAVGIRRPILSAANNGPTASIDSAGRIVERLATGTNGSIIATPTRDHRNSIYLRIGDLPAKVLAFVCILAVFERLIRRIKERIDGARS